MWVVLESRLAAKQLDRLPSQVLGRYEKWKDIVKISGPAGLAAIKGFYDHALKGEWKGFRASSLNEKWRVIYSVHREEIRVEVAQVNPHDYRK